MAGKQRGTTVTRFAIDLPRRQHLALVASGTAALVAVALDTFALALLVPTIEFMANIDADGGEAKAVGWLKSGFDTLGLEFTLKWTLIGTLVAMSCRAGLLLLMAWMATYFQATYEASLKSGGYAAIMNATWPFFLRQRAGVLSNVLMVEANRAGTAFGNLSATIVIAVNVFVYLAVAAAVSWQLSLMVMVVIVLLVIIYNGLSRIARRLGALASEANADFGAELNEGLGGAKIVKSQALEPSAVDRFTEIVERRAHVEVRLGLNRGVFSSSSELAFIVILLGGLLVATRVMDLPAATTLLFALLFIRIFQQSRAVQSMIMSLNSVLPATSVVREMTDSAESSQETVGGTPFTHLEHGIDLKDVSFAYDDGASVLRGVTLEIPTGSTVALVGSSGGGKTSIIDLAIGLLQPTEGSVLVDGALLDSYDQRSWRSKIAYVSQETVLFHDSVYNNIAWSRPDATSQEVEEAARAAMADEFVRNMADGYQTIIGDRGMRISGGQRQRLALARALLRNPEILILDEATSELDPEVEVRIGETLRGLHGQITVLVAAHRLSTIISADNIFVFEEGKIVESGTADELFALQGTFHRFYQQSR